MMLLLLSLLAVVCAELDPTLNFMTEKYFNFSSSLGQCISFDCYDKSKQCWTCHLKQKHLIVRTVALRRAHILLSFEDLKLPLNNNTYLFYGLNYEVHLYPRRFSNIFKPISYMVAAWPGDYSSDQHISRLTITLDLPVEQ